MASAVKISRPRILRSAHDQPLTLEQIKSAAPAVFQEAAHPRMSAVYAYIPTIRILEAMLEKGFTVHEVAQARPYKRENEPYKKHMIRMRLPIKAKRVGDVVPEIVLVNAHDGTAKYYLYGGAFRFLCANGLIVGDLFMKLVVAHRGGEATKSRVLEGSYKIVEDEFPKMIKQIDEMKDKMLTTKQQLTLAERAVFLRYGMTVSPFKPEQLLEVKRPQDEGDSLWNVFNRIQENVMEGGFRNQSFMFQRMVTVKPIERVDQRVKINRGLWDAAVTLL